MKGRLQVLEIKESEQITSGPLLSARELFEAAMTAQGDDRDAQLESGCKGDLRLLAMVRAMLAADQRECPALDSPLNSALSSYVALKPGDRVGSYRIVRELGAGGMGTVYLAERDGQRGRFALKLVRWLSPEIRQRFEQERAILGALNHPNIARLVDAGTAPVGSPYFVMEYVEGLPIQRYCEELKLSTDRRIRLFRQVCAAVRYLHQNLIVHRDLKPSNILVTAEGQVKLLDFGIAKLLEGRGELAPTSETNAGVMTPDYASPEQVRGGRISTLADVYTLGVLLFELLVGTKPFAAPDQSLHELLRRICDEEPPRPSSAATCGKLNRKLRGELDNIILTALRKDPERRYASVEAFDEDLRQYLDGLPVLTVGDSLVYRARKFVVRHKAAVAAAAAFAALLAVGVASTRYEAAIARGERVRAESHAIAAERASATADAQRRAADEQRLRAERFAAEAERERANSKHRLDQLEKLAHGAVNLYNYRALTGKEDDASAMIAENARDSLLMLHQEGMLKPQMTPLIAATLETLEGYRMTGNGSWQVPPGWTADGDATQYRVALDEKIVHGGKSSLFLRSLAPEPRGAVSVAQRFSAAKFLGARVRLSGYLRGEKIASIAGLRFCIGFADPGAAECEMVNPAGTSPWKKFEFVTNVPSAAEYIEFQLHIQGAGTLWSDGFAFEKVNPSVPLSRSEVPQNLNFIEPEKRNR